VREREREGEREKGREGGRDREREREKGREGWHIARASRTHRSGSPRTPEPPSSRRREEVSVHDSGPLLLVF